MPLSVAPSLEEEDEEEELAGCWAVVLVAVDGEGLGLADFEGCCALLGLLAPDGFQFPAGFPRLVLFFLAPRVTASSTHTFLVLDRGMLTTELLSVVRLTPADPPSVCDLVLPSSSVSTCDDGRCNFSAAFRALATRSLSSKLLRASSSRILARSARRPDPLAVMSSSVSVIGPPLLPASAVASSASPPPWWVLSEKSHE